MMTATIKALHMGIEHTLYVMKGDGGFWFVAAGSDVVSFTHEVLSQGVELISVCTRGVFTYHRSINSEQALVRAVVAV